MTLIQGILIAIISIICIRIGIQYKNKKIHTGELIFWGIFWLGSAIIVLNPHITSQIADSVGIGRGADLVVYISLIIIFYSIFRLFAKIRHICQIIKA